MYANPKQWAAIRQRVLVLGESIRCVSCTERMSRNTVKKMLRFESPPGYARGTRKPKTLRVASLATPPRAKTPTAESRWNAWLATVERGTDESPLPPETHQHLKAALTWGSTKARKKALVVLAQSQGFGIRKHIHFPRFGVVTIFKEVLIIERMLSQALSRPDSATMAC
jgi:hypothetical protein